MTPLDAVVLDLRNCPVVLAADRKLTDRLRASAKLATPMNEEVVKLRMQIARHTNEMTEQGYKILGQTE